MNNYNFIAGVCDTDSTSYCKPDMSAFSKEEINNLIKELNDISPEFMIWAPDGEYEACLVIRAKNYVLKDKHTQKVTLKGSIFKDQKKELIMRQMLKELALCIIEDGEINYTNLTGIYEKYTYEVINGVQDIKPWCSKKTITEKILDCKGWQSKVIQVKNKKGETRDKTVYYSKKSDNLRKNEIDVWEAIKDSEDTQEGSKIYLYPIKLPDTVISGRISEKTGRPLKDEIKSNNGLRLAEKWQPGEEDMNKLLGRIYATIKILKTILNIEDNFQDYSKVT